MVNSRLGRFAAAPAGSPREAVHLQGHPFSRSYGVNMPSSLTMVLPIASVCSTRPPVSVLVRAPAGLPRGFSREHGVGGFTQSLRRRASPCAQPGFASAAGRTLSRGRPEPRPLILLRRPIGRVASRRRCRNVRLLCIGYAFRPRLSSRLTLGGLASPRKPWTYGGRVSRPALVTHASIRTPGRSTVGCPSASPRTGRSPTTDWNQSAASAPCLAP